MMVELILPSQEYLRECCTYDAETGILTWRERPRHHFKTQASRTTWNKQHAFNQVAPAPMGKGYLRININKKRYYAHRVIWKLVTGEDVIEIDHKNRNSSDNRWTNLRKSDRASNLGNTKGRGGKSGLKGVALRKNKRAPDNYHAHIRINGTYKHIGVFETPEQAHAAYCEAAILHFGEFWCPG